MSHSHYTITAADVGKPWIKAFGRPWPVSGFIGQVLPRDVGKRVFLRGGILQVESDEQLAARLEPPRYRWDGPHEWLAEQAREWDRDRLYNELINVARRVDPDALQDEFQTEMDRDGYFRKERNR